MSLLCLATSAAFVPEKGWLDYDWVGILGTGQSLSVGARALPVVSTSQPYGNLMLSTGDLNWPVDANDPTLKLVPLVEPAGHLAPNYPSSWPQNIDGETPHTAAANQISALAQATLHRNIVTVQNAVGEDGQGMVFLKKNAIPKGLNGRSFEAATLVTRVTARLAQQAKKRYGVAAVFVTHGETDCGNPNYGNELYQLWSDYNTDLKAITGQPQNLVMIVSQQNSLLDESPSTQAQWRLGVEHPESFVCAGPKYQYPYVPDNVHLNALGYQMLGEKYGQVFFERVIQGKPWRPLEPESATRKGNQLTVKFHVPKGRLEWDTAMSPPHADVPEWANGNGFELRDRDGNRLTIQSVTLTRDGKSVEIVSASPLGPDTKLSYAVFETKPKRVLPSDGTVRWGRLRDTDPFVGIGSKVRQPNYCVAFSMIVK